MIAGFGSVVLQTASGDTTTLPETISKLLGFGPDPGPGLGIIFGIVGAMIIGVIMLTMAAFAGPWAKRKVRAAFSDSIAVNRVGPFGFLIIVADTVRLLSKELIIPENSDRPAFDIAPCLFRSPRCGDLR